ncbi:MAG TPA: hexose kinase, partial [Roseiflexaceae bacterium]|nr:hexose kinase [Roseiflexaceae bacterium]
TPNPAIDRVLDVPGFRTAEVCRVSRRSDGAGGKGLNVVRVARTLGMQACACGPLGGATGRSVAELAAAEGLECRWHWLAHGETRICVLVTDAAAHDTLTINEPGPQLDGAAWNAFAAHVLATATEAHAVAASGSLPPGVGAAQYIELLRAIKRPIYLDTSGAPLVAALDEPLAMLKVNGHELGSALGDVIATPAAAAAAARRVLQRGPRLVIVTLGRDGAVAATADEVCWARPPAIAPISPVGSGDAVLAGVAAALQQARPLGEALRLGVACGAANVLVPGPGIVLPDDIERMLAGTRLHSM